MGYRFNNRSLRDAQIVQELGEHIGGVGGQGVFAAADAPVVDEGALAHGVDAGKFGGRDGAGDLAPLLSLLGDLAQQFIIGASLV